MALQLDDSWKQVLGEEFGKEYMKNLKAFLKSEKEKGHIIFPPGSLIFNALNHTPFDLVKVVILGQDPYHGPNQAHGLSFSVQKGITPPPSLKNIFKELQQDIPGYKIPSHGDLTKWADQGVLLLNATLTVESGKPGSHQNKGWETFTDVIIHTLSAKRTGIIFLLWGRFAQSKRNLIDVSKHHVLMAAHPSPFSAHNGFLGCRHFSKTNALLVQSGKVPIDWQV
ncbi:MAG TPA: uracil-DNA glycosylase [Sphingobacteriaceae bacterium]